MMGLRRFTAGAAVLAALATASIRADAAHADDGCGHHHINRTDLAAVQVGWTRGHTQRFFDNCGVRIVMWAGGHGRRHIIKQYPGKGGEGEVSYAGPPSVHPFAAPMRVVETRWV